MKSSGDGLSLIFKTHPSESESWWRFAFWLFRRGDPAEVIPGAWWAPAGTCREGALQFWQTIRVDRRRAGLL